MWRAETDLLFTFHIKPTYDKNWLDGSAKISFNFSPTFRGLHNHV